LKRVCLSWFLTLPALFLLACSQSEGSPCQDTKDCASGLLCCLANSAQSARGTCSSLDVCPGTSTDASMSMPDDTDDSGSNDTDDDSTSN
jgi:hypothetical protein